MADYEIRRRANIGSSTLILIFIVLCLVTFAVLSMGNARREDGFSRKNAASVQEYYRADGLGEAFVQEVDRLLMEASGMSAEERKLQVTALAGSGYDKEDDCFSRDIAMDSGLALHVEVKADWEQGTCSVQAWKVFDRGVYEIDQSMPVWTGM